MNDQLEAFDFSSLTTSIYNFWLYQLCDVYLELIKPIVRGDDIKAIINAQKTLYICLDYGLKLLHPIMPYVTEELWQRLPGRGIVSNDTPSIMLAKYPLADEMYISDEIEANMDLILAAVHSGRAIRSEYMKNKSNAASQKAEFYISCSKEESKKVLEEQSDDFQTLCNASKVDIVFNNNKTIPPKCGVNITNEDIKVHMDLANLVDFASELSKLKISQKETINQLESAIKKTQIPEYDTKVPENIRQKNTEKINSLQQKLTSINETITLFETFTD